MIDLEKLAQNHGVSVPESGNDRFEDVKDPETANAEAKNEQLEREFAEPTGETETPEQESAKETSEEAKPVKEPESEETPSDVLKRWKGKSPEDIAKAHYHAEKWGKDKANENAELKRTLEVLQAQVAKIQQPPVTELPKKRSDALDPVRDKYGPEVVDMILEVAGISTKPITEEIQKEREKRAEASKYEFENYHQAYQKANPDYAESIESVRTISSNMAGFMADYMSQAGCSENQVMAAVNAMNFDKRMPYIAHTILKGENVEKYANTKLGELRKKEVEANNAKAEFGGGAPMSSESSSPKFKSTEEEWEWRRKNDPVVQGLTAFSR